jgi:hypothetical protein
MEHNGHPDADSFFEEYKMAEATLSKALNHLAKVKRNQ